MVCSVRGIPARTIGYGGHTTATRVSVKEMGGWNVRHNYQGTNMDCLTLTLKPEWLLAGDQPGLSRKA